MRVRQVIDPRDPAIAWFGELQTRTYFAPETLIPAQYVPSMLEGDSETGARRNFLLVAEADGRVVGGTLFHWLGDAGSGFSSFLGVAREMRGQGIARKLHEERLRILDQAAGGHAGVFIDVVNPVRMSREQLSRERQVGSDPWDRRSAFARLGFRQVAIRYEQPVGGPNGGPVTDLDLLFRPPEPADWVQTSLVVNTMRAYWSGWLGSAAERYAHELQDRTHGAGTLALISPIPPWP